MIVHRLTRQVKQGRLEELIALIESAPEWNGWEEKGLGRWRVYTSNQGPINMLVLELEFEDLVQLDEFWSDYFANPKSTEFGIKWDDCITLEGSNEVWRIAARG